MYSKTDYEKITKRKVMKVKWCLNVQFFVQKGLKLPCGKVVFFGFCSSSLQARLLRQVGELTDGGSVTVGVSDT